MWAGITGYFIGLAITGPVRKYSVGFVGIAIAAVLHGLNDWNLINAHFAWVLVTLISVLLFLGYARAGAWLPQQALASSPDLAPLPPGSPGPWPAGQAGHVPPAAYPGPAGYGAPAGHGAPAGYGAPAGHGAPAGYGPPAGYGAPAGQGAPAGYGPAAVPPAEAWWQHAPAAGAGPVAQPPQPAHASPAPPDSTAPHAAASHSAAAQPTVAQPAMSRRKPWWEQ